MKNILEASNVCIGYKTKKATMIVAQNLNLNLQAGKFTSLIGINGIGKSTLLRTLTGIQKPISGTVLLNEKNIHELAPLALAQEMSVVLTDKIPPSNLSVYELVALGRQPYTNWIGKLSKTDILKTMKAIELTEIEHLTKKKYYEISDGQLQKVLIARALAQDTPLIILDEPTTHLDLLHRVSLLKLMKKLTHETGKCILFSTHDIDMAIQLSDDMIVMTPEKLIQDDPCNLITKGIFNTLFKDENITFDSEKGKFLFK